MSRSRTAAAKFDNSEFTFLLSGSHANVGVRNVGSRDNHTPPTLTIQRTGQVAIQLNDGMQQVQLALQGQGPCIERRFDYEGSERANDTQEHEGQASGVHTLDSIESISIPKRDLQHPDGVVRVFATEPTMSGIWTGAKLYGGERVLSPTSFKKTSAAANIECSFTNRFVYGANPYEEMYLGWVIPKQWDADTNGSPRELGQFFLKVTNISQGRHLFTRNGLDVNGGSPGRIVLAALEYDIRSNFSGDISANETVEVELVHKAFSKSESPGDLRYVGALTGLTLLPVRKK